MRVVLAVRIEHSDTRDNLCCALWEDLKVGPAVYDKEKGVYTEVLLNTEEEKSYSESENLLRKKVRGARPDLALWSNSFTSKSYLEHLSNEEIARVLEGRYARKT